MPRQLKLVYSLSIRSKLEMLRNLDQICAPLEPGTLFLKPSVYTQHAQNPWVDVLFDHCTQ